MLLTMRSPGEILLIACYELGHQPLAVAWPAAALERAGYSPAVLDVSLDGFDAERARRAGRAGPGGAPAARAVRASRARRKAGARRIRRGEPRLQAPVPTLPDPARLRGAFLRRTARDRARGRAPARGRGRHAHHVR